MPNPNKHHDHRVDLRGSLSLRAARTSEVQFASKRYGGPKSGRRARLVSLRWFAARLVPPAIGVLYPGRHWFLTVPERANLANGPRAESARNAQLQRDRRELIPATLRALSEVG